METNQTNAHGFWRYLINSQKRATPQLEQLCLGIAKIIVSCWLVPQIALHPLTAPSQPTLEPRSDSDLLTPQRLALFYRSVGGNYDSLFLKTSEHGLSFMFTTLGCFHALQPTQSPFETPKVPCLTPDGFARWLTIQILLCPDENIGFLQKAVTIWNVPGPSNTFFPKFIPREVFPSRPDEEMENWHRMVTGKLNQKNYMRRIQNSPYQSPHLEAHDRRDEYFSGSQVGKPARPSRSSSRDDKTALYRRRSSVPDFASPTGERASHWEPKHAEGPRKARSHSAHRHPTPPGRQRSHTASSNHASQPSGSSPKSPSNRRHGANPPNQNGRPNSGYNTHYRSPARTPSTVDEDTGSEASSENSMAGHRPRRSGDDRSRRSSLWVPSIFRSHKRRHSSDASYRAPSKHTQPLRPEYYSSRASKPPPPQQHPHPSRGNPTPQWRDTNWESDASNPNPAIPMQGQAHADPRAPSIRYPDQHNFGQPLTRESSSGSGTDHRHRASDYERNSHRRQHPVPPRIATVAGVHGRQYPDALSPLERQRSHATSRGGVAAAV